MTHFKCLACNTRFYSTESEADPIGDLCPVCGSLLEPVGELGEIGGCGVIESRGSTSRSGATRAGRLIAGRVGEMIARRELKHARVRLDVEGRDAHCVSPQVQAVGSRARARARELSDAAALPTSAAAPRVPRVLGAFDAGRRRRERRRQRNVGASSSA